MDRDRNSFDAPLARVGEQGEGVFGKFLPGGRRVPVGNGRRWLLDGWTAFRTAPGTWMSIAVAFMLLTLLVSAVPFLNMAVNLLIPVFIGGISIGCRAIEHGDGIRFEHLFAGFSRHYSGLFLVGLMYLLAVILLAVVVAVVAALTASEQPSLPLRAIGFLTTLVLFVPLAMAVWLAPPLVVFHDLSAGQAIRSSFLVALRNLAPFLLYGALILLLAVLASLPMLLGWLVLLPVLYASLYAFYRDVFFEH